MSGTSIIAQIFVPLSSAANPCSVMLHLFFHCFLFLYISVLLFRGNIEKLFTY